MYASIWLKNWETGTLTEYARFDLPHHVTDVAALESVFAALNGHPASGEMQDVTRRWYADGNRSLSVDDVVVLLRDLAPGEPVLRLPYRCASVGWERCDDPDQAAAPRMAQAT